MDTNIYRYESNQALWKAIESKETEKAWASGWASIQKNSDADTKKFAGQTIPESLHDVRFGDVKNAKRIKSAQSKLLNKGVDSKRIFMRDVIGCLPNIPAYLMGLPKQMFNVKMEYNKTPTLNLYVNITVHCGVKKEDMANAGAKIANVIKDIEDNDIRVNLFTLSGIKGLHNNDNHIICTCVKKAESPLNLLNIAFAFVNPAFFRNICLLHLEKYYPYEIYGHGKPTTNKDMKPYFSDGVILSTLDIITYNKTCDDIANEINTYMEEK